jgi:hypothetical protein
LFEDAEARAIAQRAIIVTQFFQPAQIHSGQLDLRAAT